MWITTNRSLPRITPSKLEKRTAPALESKILKRPQGREPVLPQVRQSNSPHLKIRIKSVYIRLQGGYDFSSVIIEND